MHRRVLGEPSGFLVDHINGVTLDNRRSNLRAVRAAENAKNRASAKGSSSPFLGVSIDNLHKKWVAQIQIKGKKVLLGLFTDETEAARAYDRASIKYHKEFGNTNFPREEYAALSPAV